MEWIDTHTHLFLDAFDADRDQVIQRAQQAGVRYMLLPNIDENSLQALYTCEQAYADCCKPMMGLHPCSVHHEVNAQLQVIQQQLDERDFIAVGEIGLDYYWDLTYRTQQLEAFRTQLHWAGECHLPVSIHSRSAIDDCIQEIKKIQKGQLFGVFHCFTGTKEQAQQIIDLGFALGIGGVITFAKSDALRQVISQIPLQHLVLETDAPYLAPVPFRGKRNESCWIPHIAHTLASLFQLDDAEIARITTANALRIFAGLSKG
ncbi:MAG: TatD family hydrolase [Thermoflavifilum sp.]|nr:TatD family hydrolase [Thermoflavifilum sp.]